MDEDQQKIFEQLVKTFEKWASGIPIQFLLGFYVSTIVSRWWQQMNSIAWPDRFLVHVTSYLHGFDDRRKEIRRTFARYSNLLSVLVWKEISIKIKKRFPTDEHLLKAGLMTEHEFELYQNTAGEYGRWFVPVSWMLNLLARCRHEGLISDRNHQKLVDELYALRGSSAMLTIYDWINVPLVYTQVAAIATYGFFAFCLICRQTLLTDTPDIVFPVYNTLEFIFYMGWLSVGQELRCPFGEDDEDFNMNYVLDRNVHVANMLVDELHDHDVRLCRDAFWGDRHPKLPHTRASAKVKDEIPDWRYGKIKVKQPDQEILSDAEMVDVKQRKSQKNGGETAEIELKKLNV